MEIGHQGIAEAAARIAPHVRVTPAVEVQLPGLPPLALKLENLQVTGSFKARGAFNTLLTEGVPPAGVVAASGGNHGAAVGHAAVSLGHAAHIFVPELAGPAKTALIRATGARLTIVPGTVAEAFRAVAEEKARTGALEIHPYDAPRTVEGQGTLFREWDAQGLDADTVLVAVGGGGLIAGALAWWGARRKVVAVEPELAPTLQRSLAEGPQTEVAVGGIAANALGARRIGAICHALATRHGTPAVLVPDAAIAAAQRLLWDGLRQFVEPGGATALAALLCGAYLPAPGERVAVLVCGANPAPGPFAYA